MDTPRPVDPPWDIGVDGRAWRKEAMSRYEALPEKIEMIEGKLCWSEEDRLTLLAALLENVGLAAAVRLAPVRRWRQALEQVEDDSNRGGDR